MNTKLPLVSIIMPSYNCGNFITASIQSVIKQTYQSWELIICDDCSSDNSIAKIQKQMLKEPRVKFIKNKQHKGAAATRNSCIKQANGRFIAFLDSDDIWYSDKLKKQVNFMLKNKIAFSYTWYDILAESSKPVGDFKPQNPSTDYNNLLKRCDVGCLTAMYDTKLLGKQYMPDILKRQDFGLWLKLLKLVPKAYCLQQKLAAYRLRSNSVSSNKLRAAYYNWLVYRKLEGFSVAKSLYLLLCYTIFYFRNKAKYAKHRKKLI